MLKCWERKLQEKESKRKQNPTVNHDKLKQSISPKKRIEIKKKKEDSYDCDPVKRRNS